MELGDVIEIKNYKPVKIDQAKENGKYPFYNCSILGHLWSDKYLYEDEVLIMNKTNGSGKCNIYYNNGKFSISGGVIIFKPINNININYLYYYLLSNKEKISENFVGGDKKNLNMNGFKKLKIPIPSLEIQNDIIKRIEKLNESGNHYIRYTEILNTEINNIMETIHGMTLIDNHLTESN